MGVGLPGRSGSRRPRAQLLHPAPRGSHSAYGRTRRLTPRLIVATFVPGQELGGPSTDAGFPEMFRGWPVHFGWDEVPVSSHVTVTALRPWLLDQLGVDALSALSTRDWLLTPQQRILGVVAGATYADDSGQLTGVRRRLAWYPDDVWRWLVACQWRRIEQEEAFVQRTAEVGDDLGSHVVAGRLVRDMMRMALLLDRRYAPYSKWLGSAFAAVQHDDGLASQLSAILSAGGTSEREEALAVALTTLARRHNEARISDEVAPTTWPFHSRQHGRPVRSDAVPPPGCDLRVDGVVEVALVVQRGRSCRVGE